MCVSCPGRARTRCFTRHGRRLLFDRFHPLRESGISCLICLCRACMYNTYNSHRKYNVPSRLTYPTWATSTVVASATYARPARNPPHASLPPSHMQPLVVVSDKSSKQGPTPALARLHSHLFVRRGSDHRTTAISPTPHSHPPLSLCIAGITRILPSRLRSARASGTRSMPRLRASGSPPWSALVVFGTGSER